MHAIREAMQGAGRTGSGHGRRMIGLGLICCGVFRAAGKLGWPVSGVDWPDLAWPVVIAAAGAFLLFGCRR